MSLYMSSLTGGGISQEDICAICTESGADKDTGVAQVQICPRGHYAHIDCITPWYATNKECPECRTDVTSFQLWKEINPIEQTNKWWVVGDQMQEEEAWNEIENPSRFEEDFLSILDANNYEASLLFFGSPVGRAYVQWALESDKEEFNRQVYYEDEDESVVSLYPLIQQILERSAFNVANALYRVFEELGEQQSLTQYSGPVINEFYLDNEIPHANWLYSHGYGISHLYLDNAASSGQVEAVKWYLQVFRPARQDELLLQTMRFAQDDEEEVYRVIKNYVDTGNVAGIVEQRGGMWQRGGFFMTCY